MVLDGMRVGGLTKDLQQSGIGNEEETREEKTFLLKVSESVRGHILKDAVNHYGGSIMVYLRWN